jgi:AmpE protein
MKFIITLIALVIERFFDWSHIRRWRWFERFLLWLNKKLSSWPTYLVLGIAVLPAVLVVALLNCFLTNWVYGLLKLVFGILVLMYSLGPQNFWLDAYRCIAALQHDDQQVAMERVKKAFDVSVSDSLPAFHRAFVNALFCEANRRLFAVWFWFILLGPAGALLYRLIDLCRLHGLRISFVADQLQSCLDWLPVRLFALFFGLAGHFTKAIKQWKRDVLTKPARNSILLSECGVEAVDVLEAERMPVDGSAEKETIRLLDRVFVIALVVLAIVVLV